MQEGNPFEQVDFKEGSPRFSGRFLVFENQGDLPNQNYVLGFDKEDNSTYISGMFESIAQMRYGASRESLLARAHSQGRIEIGDSQISVKGVESRHYSGYNESVVRPIVERFAQEYLPDHELNFK